MITLTLNGDPLPTILTAYVPVELSILVDGVVPLQTEWSVWTSVEIARGTGSTVRFSPDNPVTTYINVQAIKGDGSSQTEGFTVQVLASRTGPVEAWIDWSQLRYAKTDPLVARVNFSDPQGRGYQRVTWNLYRNSIWQAAGSGHLIRYDNADHGVYRVVAEVIDYAGNTITADSSTVVSGGFEVQPTLQPVPGRTMQFLGYAYTGEQIGESSFASSVGMAISAMAEEVYLLPGTTYYQVELDPAMSNGPGQVLVRTPTGNWSVKGRAPRDIDLPYEFLDNSFFIPAPADLRLQISTESFATSVGTQPSFGFRVRIRCYYDGVQVYRFRPCDDSRSVGGRGMRARRFTVLFSQVDLLTDADTTEQRLGSPASVLQTYVTDLPDTLPIPLSLEGLPDISVESNRLFYTDQNWVTSYDPEAPGTLEVNVHSTYAIEQARPFSMSFMMPAYPTIIQRPRRLHGRVALYLANGYVNAGAVANLEISGGGGFIEKSVTIPITADAFSPDLATYIKVAEADVDVSDAEFADNGLVGLIRIAEDSADLVTWPVGLVRPDPVPLEEEVYSATPYPYARLDGACYYNAGEVQVMAGTTTGTLPYTVDYAGTIYPMESDIVGCYDPKCVPVGLYCYGEYGGTDTLHVPQPLYHPAPYVAPADQVTHCYCDPCLLDTWIGTGGVLPAYTPFVAYQSGTMCGVPWGYDACNGVSQPLVVPYPADTVPPDYVAYAGTCYGITGTLATTTGCVPVSRDEVSPVYSCQDAVCTGFDPSGKVVRYQDLETGRDVDVYIDHLDAGMPFFGVIPETYDDGIRGLTAGSVRVLLTKSVAEYPVMAVAGTGTLNFRLSTSTGSKVLVRYRQGIPFSYELNPGVGEQKIEVLPGDRIAFRMYAPKTSVLISWTPWVPRPRLYASGTLSYTGTTPINALGFTGLTDRSEYAFYGTLGADVESTEVNPDSVVTVVSRGVEYVLLRARGISDTPCALPKNSVWYGAGTPLVGPFVFRLYAGREDAGQAGDMDVWINQAGTLPDSFQAGPYCQLIKNGDLVTTSRVPEVERNSLRVTATTPFYRSPSVYVSIPGDRLVLTAPPVLTRPRVMLYANDVYIYARSAPGAAYRVLPWYTSGSITLWDGATVDMLVRGDGTRMFVAKVRANAAYSWVTPRGGTRDTLRQTTLGFLTSQSAQIAINGNFFLPFPSSDMNAACVGLAASGGDVYSPFEPQPIGIGYPDQSYAILPYAPALNIDPAGVPSIVHHDPSYLDNKHVLEPVTLWSATGGSAQVITNGVKTIPIYGTGPGMLNAINGYSNSNSWYALLRARTVAGVTQDKQTIVLCVVEGLSGSMGGTGGMAVGDIVDVLIQNYGVYDAINLDGGGSSSMAVQIPVNGGRVMLNSSPDGITGRNVANNLALFGH